MDTAARYFGLYDHGSQAPVAGTTSSTTSQTGADQ
jgi:hypothetical protein